MPRIGTSSSSSRTQGTTYLDGNPFDKGSIYYDLWNANPYANMYYEPSFWDNLGLSDKAKDMNASYDQQYREWIASIYDLKAQNEYNSPQNQVFLEKMAGLNPDLTGVSGVGKSDGLNYQGQQPAALNGQSSALNGFNIITSVLGFATSAMQSISQIKNLSSITQGQKLSNFDFFLKLAEPHIVNEYANRFSGGYHNNWSDVRDVSASAFGSRSQRNQYKKAFDFMLGSSRFTSAEKAYQNLNANDRAMNDFIGGIVELEFLKKKHGYQADIAKSQYDADYWNSVNANSAAAALNRENDTRGWLDKWRNKFYKKLYDDFKRGSDLAGFLLIGSGNITGTTIGAAALNQIDRGLSNSLINFWNKFN